MKSNHHSTFSLLHSALVLTFTLASALLVSMSSATAETVAYWRFEEGPADAQVLHGGLPDGVFFPGVVDSSGYGNGLSVWAEGWAGYAYRTDVSMATVPLTSEANNFSVQNTGGYPAMFTQTGTFMQFIQPFAFTIEVSFKPETGGWRTLVGRDRRCICRLHRRTPWPSSSATSSAIGTKPSRRMESSRDSMGPPIRLA
jgi:hypothetical protein